MLKIAILGTENSHAMAFSKFINLAGADGKKPLPDIEVIGVYGDEASANAIVKETGVKTIAKNPHDFLGKVDAIMVTARRGSQHFAFAKPYAEAGLPMFIDKPFTSSSAEAEKFASILRSQKVLVSGGSAVKYAPAVKELKNKFKKMQEENKFVTAVLSAPVVPDSEYDGLFFYAPHLVETALEIFGSGVKTISATRKGDNITAILGYDTFDVTLLFTNECWLYSGVLYGKEEITYLPIDISKIFDEEVKIFHNMLISGEMPCSYDDFVLPVKIIEKIDESYKSGKKLMLN